MISKTNLNLFQLLVPFIVLFAVCFLYKLNIDALTNDNRLISKAIAIETFYGNYAGKAIEVKNISEKSIIEYTVKAKDNYWTISRRFGVKDHYELIQFNKNKKLHPGVKIKIPKEMIEK